jgi:hypothetical protein
MERGISEGGIQLSDITTRLMLIARILLLITAYEIKQYILLKSFFTALLLATLQVVAVKCTSKQGCMKYAVSNTQEMLCRMEAG